MGRLLELKDLRTYFFTSDGVIPAVDGVTFHVDAGEILGVVGESGCGKSVTALSILKLIRTPPGRFMGGEIRFEGEDLLAKSPAEIRKIRGRRVAMVFQEPMTCLNPVYTIGQQIAEVVQLHEGLDRGDAIIKAQNMLGLVGIADPERRTTEYPHQLSGGIQQRAMIAMALSCNPALLIADEPTTALDVTIQAQILDLMKDIRSKMGMAIMLITHDLGVVAEMAERVVVMYAGKVVEEASVNELFSKPVHPYTEALLNCTPRVDHPRGKLNTIEGVVPNPLGFPSGCRFHPRCEYSRSICKTEEPALAHQDSRRYACHFPRV